MWLAGSCERFERDGVLVEERKPNLLSVVCSEATADTLTRALKKVTAYRKGASYQEGTAANSMNGVGCEVAGKTGTAWIYLEGDDAIGKTAI